QNKARQDVAQMLERQETEAKRVQWEIEARGRADLTAAQNEAKARQRLGPAYRDNRAVLQYELARRRLDVGTVLAGRAPKPLVVRTSGGDTSALSTLLLAQLLPQLSGVGRRAGGEPADRPESRDDAWAPQATSVAGEVADRVEGAVQAALGGSQDGEATSRPADGLRVTWR
ncbi:MAG TPA: hypothetical protein VGR21_02910, partial [Cryptosporangiaceae bacterium]|nr:hypothetical protein [Cryptosporangiaceae bacterium]